MTIRMVVDPSYDFDGIISRFIVEACEVDRNSTFAGSWYTAYQQPFTFTCGSSAEFYITPFISCIDDFDYIYAGRNLLACTENNLVLPNEIHRYSDQVIELGKIESFDDFPGFIRLRKLGEFHYDWSKRNYVFLECQIGNVYFKLASCRTVGDIVNDIKEAYRNYTLVPNGPAIRIEDENVDSVGAIWCPQWPKEAAEWSTRPRRYNWPTNYLIQKITKNGCHIVHAKHRRSRDDIHQARFSFSFAEVILIRSWNPIQQVVYHILRHFAKKTLIRKDCPKDDQILCPYHLKTLMLWTCEEEPPDRWNSSNVIEICRMLLRKLQTWMQKGHCPNYFIPSANLFVEYMNPDRPMVNQALEELKRFCIESNALGRWSAAMYAIPICKEVANLTGDEKSLSKLEMYVEDRSILKYYHLKEYTRVGLRNLTKLRKTVKCCSFKDQCLELSSFKMICREEKFHKEKKYFSIKYFFFSHEWKASLLLLTSLHLTYAVYTLIFGENVRDSEIVMHAVFLTLHGNPPFKYIGGETHLIYGWLLEESHLYFLKAQDFLLGYCKSVTSSEFLLRSRMSKEFLRRALMATDSKLKSLKCASVVYLAALLFVESDFPNVVKLLSLVNIGSVCKKDTNEVLNGNCLLFIDVVSGIIGFLILYTNTRETSRPEVQGCLDFRITPEVFSQYLASLLLNQNHRPVDFGCELHLSLPVFTMDVPLIALARRNSLTTFHHEKVASSRVCIYISDKAFRRCLDQMANSYLNRGETIRLVMECSLEYMSLFFKDMENFGVRSNIFGSYRAMYLFKYRRYEEASCLCEKILDEHDEVCFHNEIPEERVVLREPLSALFEEDIQLLYGVELLADFVLRPKLRRQTRALFIETHFLAKYLKAKCLIQMGIQNSETERMISTLMGEPSFEYYIILYLSRKLQRIA